MLAAFEFIPQEKKPELLPFHYICKSHTNMRVAEGTTEFRQRMLAPPTPIVLNPHDEILTYYDPFKGSPP